MRVLFTIMFSVLLAFTAHSQQKQVLRIEEFITQVKQFHPVAQQAELVTERADADLLAVRGNFDPLLSTNTADKTLDGTRYYRYRNSELKIPTGIGVNVKGGFENSSGQYINPELTNGVASYLGVEVPLLNGLLTDKKRTALQQAKIYQQQSESERRAMLNDLLFDAYGAYWKWAGAYRLYTIYANYVTVAEERANLVKLYYRNGDRAMADTIEAFAQAQTYRLMQAEALQELISKTVDLSNYLWTAEQDPYLLPDNYIPDTTQFYQLNVLPDTTQLIAQANNLHPDLQVNQFKLQILEAEKRLKFQNLLPTANVQANILSKDYFQYKNVSATFLENNYKLGINISVPLFLRQGRGEYQAVKIKIRETTLDLERKSWEIQNKIRKYAAEYTQLQNQLQTAEQMNTAYNSLLRTEELKFTQGESSLFLINTRENKALEMQQKLIELYVKYQVAGYGVMWAGGRLL